MSVDVCLVVGMLTPRQVFVRVVLLCAVSIISPVLHTHGRCIIEEFVRVVNPYPANVEYMVSS